MFSEFSNILFDKERIDQRFGLGSAMIVLLLLSGLMLALQSVYASAGVAWSKRASFMPGSWGRLLVGASWLAKCCRGG